MQKSKEILLFGALMLSSVAVMADINAGLVAYYSFDDCTANDNSGNGHNGVIQGNPQCVAARMNKGFKFDGIYDSITFQSMNQYFATNNFSISYFFKNGNLLRRESIIGKRPHCGNGPFFDIRALATNVTYEIGDGLGDYNLTSFKTQLGIVFITMVRKGNTVLIYHNGKQVRQIVTKTVTDITNTAPLGVSISPCIGVDGTKKFSGLIDELRVYNRALNASEITELYNSALPVSGIVRSLPNYTVRCKNETTGQVVDIDTIDTSAYDCEAGGLIVNKGQAISILIKGNAQ